MSHGIWTAVSSASTQLTALDTASNNVANAHAAGFHGDQPVFREVLSKAQGRGGARAGTMTQRFAIVDPLTPTTTTGEFQHTGRPLDVAIEGKGFFVLQTENGERYTRVGKLQLADRGELVDLDGNAFLDKDRRPIFVPKTAKTVRISADGGVMVNDNRTADLLVVEFPKATPMLREGRGLVNPVGNPKPKTVGKPWLVPESIEESNVVAVKEMANIISASRTFDTSMRAIEAFKEADRKAANTLMAGR